LSANRLQRSFGSGELFERYNSERKANITILVFSLGGLVALGYFEYLRKKKKSERRGYIAKKVEPVPPLENPKVTNIYSAPETLDKWNARRTRSSRSQHHDEFELTHLWLRVLRIYCAVLPIIYFYILVEYMVNWLPVGMGNVFWTILTVTLFILSVSTSVGFFRKQLWGIQCGYGIAIFHLLIFPIGTVSGLLMLIALAGVAPEFSADARRRRRKAHHQREDNNTHAVMV